MMSTPNTEVYPLIDALAAAAAVYRVYGFIKRNQGYWDTEHKCLISDSRSIVLNTLRLDDQKADDIVSVEVIDTDRDAAQELFNFFDQKVLLAKMSDSLNDYDQRLVSILGKLFINCNQDLAIISSLPNSRVIQGRRDFMQEFYDTNRHTGSFVGQQKERLCITATVLDVKWIPKSGIYLVTMVTKENQIVKFFLKDEDTDVSENIRDKTIKFVGTVRNQEVNDWTGCHETMFNRVKIE